MIEETSKSFWQTMRDRAANPLGGAFVISWVAWNWRLLGILLLTDGPFVDRMRTADGLGLTTVAAAWLPPLVAAWFWVLTYPYAARWATEWTERRRRATKLSVRRIRRDPILSLDEAKALRAYCREVEQRHGADVERLGAQVQRLVGELRDAKSEVARAYSVRDAVLNAHRCAETVVHQNLVEDLALAWASLSMESWQPTQDDAGHWALYQCLKEHHVLTVGRQKHAWCVSDDAQRALLRLIEARQVILHAFNLPPNSPPRPPLPKL